MKKSLLLSGIAMLCLLSQTAFVSTAKSAKAGHHKKGKLIISTASGAYYNSNAFPITVLFEQFGHPVTEFTIPTGYSSGMYSVPTGTYDIEFVSSGPAEYEVSGYASKTGSDETFSGVVLTTTSEIIFEAELP